MWGIRTETVWDSEDDIELINVSDVTEERKGGGGGGGEEGVEEGVIEFGDKVGCEGTGIGCEGRGVTRGPVVVNMADLVAMVTILTWN